MDGLSLVGQVTGLAVLARTWLRDEEPAQRGVESADSHREELNSIVRDFLVHDTEFHELIIGAAGNNRLVRAVRSWRESISALGGWRLTRSPRLEDLLEEHKDILKTLKGPHADPMATVQTMYEHIRRTGDLLMKELKAEYRTAVPFTRAGLKALLHQT
jgi:DNA-binding GntR family transcriptional regulator